MLNLGWTLLDSLEASPIPPDLTSDGVEFSRPGPRNEDRLKAQNPGAAMSPQIPMVVEQPVHGERTFDIYSRLLGSGTTAVAALRNGRRFVGGDLEPDCVQTTRTGWASERDLDFL